MIFSPKKRRMRAEQHAQWRLWCHVAHLYKWAEWDLKKVASGVTEELHDFPGRFCLDQPGTQPMSLQITVARESVRAEHVQVHPGPRLEITNVMEWPFDRYTPVVEDDGRRVRFRNDDSDDPGNHVYVAREGSWATDLGFWVSLAAEVHKYGMDAVRKRVRADRAAQMQTEPEHPLTPQQRRRELGNVDDLSTPTF